MIRTSLRLGVLSVLVAACGGEVAPGEQELGVSRQALQVDEPAATDQHSCGDHEDEEEPGAREHASRRVSWRHHQHPGRGVVPVRLLGLNDFHGRLSEGLRVSNRPVGGAAVLASYLKDAASDFESRSLILHAGDHVGASPPESALLQDEPAIEVLNLLANRYCRAYRGHAKSRSAQSDERCNIVGTPGNHEFDEGATELLRLIHGGNHPDGPFLDAWYGGAKFPYVSSNVVREQSGRTLLPASTIVRLGGVRVGVIGAVLKETPTIVTPTGVAGLEFGDEPAAINEQVEKLSRRGVEAIVVTIHQGARQTPSHETETDPASAVGQPISGIVAQLSDEVDVVVSGHAHAFTNALVKNANGVDILVTQAFANGTAYGEIDLELDRRTGDVVSKSARIVTTFSDQAPGDVRDADVQELVDAARARVAPLVNEVIVTIAGDANRNATPAGESSLGNLIADAQRAAMGTDFAFMNPGGIRADLLFAADPNNPADVNGTALWGELFTVQPFGNSLVRLQLTGAQVVQLLEQQWLGQPFARILQVSGLSYTWDASKPDGQKIVQVRKDGVAIDPAATYSVTANSFIAAGGDGFTVFPAGTGQEGGPIDLDALIDFLEASPEPVAIPALDRITRLN